MLKSQEISLSGLRWLLVTGSDPVTGSVCRSAVLHALRSRPRGCLCSPLAPGLAMAQLGSRLGWLRLGFGLGWAWLDILAWLGISQYFAIFYAIFIKITFKSFWSQSLQFVHFLPLQNLIF